MNGITPADFSENSKAYYIKKYFDDIIRNAPPFEHFGVHNLIKSIYGFNSPDSLRFNEVAEMVECEMMRSGGFEKYGSWQYLIDDDFQSNYINPPSYTDYTPTHNIYNYHAPVINESTISNAQINQDSRFENSPNTISAAENPKKKENHSIFFKFWDLVSNNKIVSGITLAVILYLIKQWFGITL